MINARESRFHTITENLKNMFSFSCLGFLILNCCRVQIRLPVLRELLPWEKWNNTHTYTLYTQAPRLCITVITPQRMLGNLVKDVRNVNHLQSALLSHWSILPPPGELHWSLVQPAVSVGLFSCCSPRHIESQFKLQYEHQNRNITRHDRAISCEKRGTTLCFS